MKIVPVSRTEILLNNFATRCFRDVADADYIAARLSYRAGLFSQFQWSGLQACEKYLKGILLYNRIPSHEVGHSLKAAFELAKGLPFEIELSDTSRSIIEHLDDYGPNRYLIWSFEIYGPKLHQLDKAVWELRRYCTVLNWKMEKDDGKQHEMLSQEIAVIRAAEKSPPQRHRIIGGLLEQIIEKKGHPAREPLLWKNMCYGKRVRNTVRVHIPSHFTNAPLTLNPELLDHVSKYVYLPSDAKRAYRQHLAEVTKKRKLEAKPKR